MKFFSPSPVLAFMSDATIDFTPENFDSPLSHAQQAYIKKETGLDIPQVFWRKQIHGDDVLYAKDSSKGCPDADAYITDQKKFPIAIRTADCVPVFIYDPIKHVAGLAHAGWKGTHKEIALKTARQMQEKFGCRGEDLKAALGPSIRPCCYAVGDEFRNYFPDDTIFKNGKIYADVVGANRRQLIKAGLNLKNIYDSGVCTCCNPNYFSFRRDADKAGRMISIMMLL